MSEIVGWVMKATGISYWGLIAAAVGAVILTVSGISLKIYEDGHKAAMAEVVAKSKKEQIALQAKADKAEHAHDQELADLQKYRDTHTTQPVQLCLSAPVQAAGNSAQSRSASRRATTAAIQQMFAGSPGSGPGRAGPDIGPMLEAIGAAADKVSAERRELHNIVIPLAGKQ